jgi:hypothetical protein
MQRAFALEILGDGPGEAEEWLRTLRAAGGAGQYASYYAAVMLGLDRSAQALDVLGQSRRSDAWTRVSRAYLLLDIGRDRDALGLGAEVLESQQSLNAMGASVLLLAGDTVAAAAVAAEVLESQGPDDPIGASMRPELEFWAGRRSAPQILAGAGGSRSAQCGAHYAIGLAHLARGEREDAMSAFRASIATGAHFAHGYQWSRAFAARLARDPQWPPWISR